MRPHAVYIIAQDGRSAYSKLFSDKAPNEDLVSAMLVAMQNFVKEVTGTYFNELNAGPIQFSSEKAGPFYVVLVSTKSNLAKEKAQLLGIRFMRKYKTQIENWKGETLDFEEFESDINEVLGEFFTENRRQDPTNPLDASTLIFLEKELLPIARYLLKREEASVSTIAHETGFPQQKTKELLEKLFDKGHVGKYVKDGEEYFFVK